MSYFFPRCVMLACISVAIPTLVDARDEILLPTLEGPIENTAASHPWNGAMWQKVPLHLSDYDYVEEEYYVSGNAHVYDWVPGSNFELVVLDASSGKWLPYEQKGQIEPTAYTSRIMIRRPQDMQKFSGRVVVEIINMTAGYDWTAIWGALWEQILKQGDVYVGLTSKPNVFPGMVRFDAARYGPLSMPNPLPAAAQICGTLPGEPDYDPNLSRLTENGLAWDMFSGLGALLKSERVGNPLGQAAKRLYLTGESQSGFYLARYFRWFHQRANLGNGDPVYDGYLAETGGTDTAEIEGLHQCANELNPLPADDLQRAIPGRGVPYFVVHSQWDFPLSKWPPYDWPASVRRPNANTALDKFMLWELAGASHGWTWQYDYSDAAREDVTAAGFETYDFSCGVNQPEIKLYMVEKAAYVLLHRWVTTDAAPPAADYIATDIPEHPQDPLRDVYGNAIGGLRMPEIAVPVAAYTGAYAPDPDCRNVVLPFDADTLKTLYPAPGDYLEKFTAVTGDLVTDGFLLPADAARLIEAAGSRRIH